MLLHIFTFIQHFHELLHLRITSFLSEFVFLDMHYIYSLDSTHIFFIILFYGHKYVPWFDQTLYHIIHDINFLLANDCEPTTYFHTSFIIYYQFDIVYLEWKRSESSISLFSLDSIKYYQSSNMNQTLYEYKNFVQT